MGYDHVNEGPTNIRAMNHSPELSFAKQVKVLFRAAAIALEERILS